MKKTYLHIIMCLMALSLTTISCKEDEGGMNVAPGIVLAEVDTTTIFRTGATLTATILNDNNRSISESGFILSTSADFENMTLDNIRTSSSAKILVPDETVSNGKLTYLVKELQANTTYYYQAFINSGFSSARSAVLSFKTTETNSPKFSEIKFENITLTSCTASFEVLDLGGDDKIATLEFWYKPVGANQTVSFLNRDECEIDDASAYTKTFDGLTKNTRYAVCVHATTNEGREGTSAVNYFTTANYNVTISTPLVDAGPEFFVVSSVITTNDTVIAEGIFYSQENTLPNENNLTAADLNIDKNISVTVDNLEKGLYYIRAYAKIQKSGTTFFVYSDAAQADVSEIIYNAPIMGACIVTNETSSSFDVSSTATLQNEGDSPIKERGFCYVEGTATPTTNDNTIAISSGKPFSATINGLKANTQYTVCSYAINEQGTLNYSPAVTVRTKMKTPGSDDNVFPGTR